MSDENSPGIVGFDDAEFLSVEEKAEAFEKRLDSEDALHISSDRNRDSEDVTTVDGELPNSIVTREANETTILQNYQGEKKYTSDQLEKLPTDEIETIAQQIRQDNQLIDDVIDNINQLASKRKEPLTLFGRRDFLGLSLVKIQAKLLNDIKADLDGHVSNEEIDENIRVYQAILDRLNPPEDREKDN